MRGLGVECCCMVFELIDVTSMMGDLLTLSVLNWFDLSAAVDKRSDCARICAHGCVSDYCCRVY